MSDNLTEKEFSQHLNSTFQVKFVDGELPLELVEVKSYPASPSEQSGMERFSVFFDGPRDLRLPQATYQLQHPEMGDVDIFLVPISGDEKGIRYEAVFNYYK